MKLNIELIEIFKDLEKALNKEIVAHKNLISDGLLTLHFKTPNIFYKKYKVFIDGDTEDDKKEITELFSENFISTLKKTLAGCYFNYFVIYNESFRGEYYSTFWKMDSNNKLKLVSLGEIPYKKNKVFNI